MNMRNGLAGLVTVLSLLIVPMMTAKAAETIYLYEFLDPSGPPPELAFGGVDFLIGPNAGPLDSPNDVQFIASNALSVSTTDTDFSFTEVEFATAGSYFGADFSFPSLPMSPGSYPVSTLVLTTLDPATGQFSQTTENSWTLTIQAIDIQTPGPEPIPEPASLSVLGISLLGLVAARYRCRRHKHQIA
jgi:PEP-CTERM motif